MMNPYEDFRMCVSNELVVVSPNKVSLWSDLNVSSSYVFNASTYGQPAYFPCARRQDDYGLENGLILFFVKVNINNLCKVDGNNQPILTDNYVHDDIYIKSGVYDFDGGNLINQYGSGEYATTVLQIRFRVDPNSSLEHGVLMSGGVEFNADSTDSQNP